MAKISPRPGTAGRGAGGEGPAAWSAWRGPARDGQVAWLPERLDAQPKILWRTPLTEVALAGVAATENHVLVADRELNDTVDVFRCLDADTGKERWAHRYPATGALDYGNSPRATPLIDGERVFFFGAHGHLRCVKLATGLIVWQRNVRSEFGVEEALPWGFCGSPLLVAGKLILNPGGPQASLVAFDPATGKTLWHTPGLAASYGSFIATTLGGKLQIVGHDQTTLGGWDVATGKRLWTVTPPSDRDFHVPTPIVDRGRLIVATESSGTSIYAFRDDGQIVPEPIATLEDLKPDTHTPVVIGRRLFGVSGRLFCLDLEQPLKEIFRATDPGFRRHTSLIASPDRLLISTDTGELILIDGQADAYRELGRMQVFDDERGLLSHPALVGRRLFWRASREIVCVDLEN